MPRSKAEKIARDFLSKVDLEHIEFKRENQCTIVELFYVMFIRALMSKNEYIFIEVKHSVLESLKDIKSVFQNINLLKGDKNIFILDLLENENYYKGSLCNIVK